MASQPPFSPPPPPPSDVPTMSAIPFEEDPQMGAMPPPGTSGAIPKLFFDVEQQLQTIAKVIPIDMVEDLATIAQSLRALTVKVLQRGPTPPPAQGMEGLAPSPSPAGGMTP